MITATDHDTALALAEEIKHRWPDEAAATSWGLTSHTRAVKDALRELDRVAAASIVPNSYLVWDGHSVHDGLSITSVCGYAVA